MLRWRGVNFSPSGWGRCVVTIGVFDGVHLGHQHIIRTALARARDGGLPCLVLTFDPHPIEVLAPGTQVPMLTSLPRRAELFAEIGVDALCVAPFTKEFSLLSAEEFAADVLGGQLHAAEVVVGENFRFGHKAAGSVELLQTIGATAGFTAHGVALVRRTREDQPISSTFIRQALAAGDVTSASVALGRPHRITGMVMRGHNRGAQLGFPTANVHSDPRLVVPADGVYAGRAVWRGKPMPAAISIGSNPTFDDAARQVEAYILDFDENLYGESLSLDFVARLRDMRRFDRITDLTAAMHHDVAETRRLVS